MVSFQREINKIQSAKKQELSNLFAITKEATQALLEWSGQDNVMIRFRITTPCCNQRKYDLTLTDTITTQDAIYTHDSVQVIYHPTDLPYLRDTMIDYNDGGFFIRHPHPLVQPF
ncbi:hypothetical protein CKF48_20195 [Cytobacillus kochii]|uniref:Core domain-containing protein n=1 Tax=Cytobacillus kochii TaxID=859143 RepID=A0A286R7Y7_9BACI|nr:hypothetical protein CKF48_20195 [Cytobacillus kochii]